MRSIFDLWQVADFDFLQVADQLRRRLVRLSSLSFSADQLDERLNALLALQCCGKVLQTESDAQK